MTLTELRETLTAVSDAVPVPAPDALAFQRRVASARRRRTTGRLAGAVTAAAVVSVAATVSLGGHRAVDSTPPTRQPTPPAAAGVPVVVEGRLRLVQPDHTLGPAGPAVASVVGTTPEGVVVLTDDGTLERVDGDRVERLVPDRVRTAYLAGDAVVYEDRRGSIRFWGISPTVQSSDSAHTDEGRLLAASDNGYVEAADSGGVWVHTADGIHELSFDHPRTVLHQVEVGGDVVVVRADDEVVFFDLEGHQTEERGGGELLGALAPDGHAYAQVDPDSFGILLVDPASADAHRIPGPTTHPVAGGVGSYADVGWAPDGDLLIVLHILETSTLLRCGPDGSACQNLLTEPTGTLWLGQVPR